MGKFDKAISGTQIPHTGNQLRIFLAPRHVLCAFQQRHVAGEKNNDSYKMGKIMLEWKKLLCDDRRKDKFLEDPKSSLTRGQRTEIERDYDRILFAAPTRRLADKTQVFPLEPSDSIRTRLTHSHEVSNLARSVGMTLAFDKAEDVFGSDHNVEKLQRKVPALLAAIGLAHDLGNPPFGHQGEVAVRAWFNKKTEIKNIDDFKNFDGNPQTFRLLTKLQILNNDFGLNLTYATLSALVKYPSLQSSEIEDGYEKFGIFQSEKDVIDDVWEATGLCEGVRHPFAHIMEACDDIAYSVIDAEDTVKKGFASFYDLIDHLKNGSDETSKRVVEKSEYKNDELKKEGLSSSELNDMSMQMFRVYAIHELVESITKCFIENVNKMMDMNIDKNFELIKHSDAASFCKSLKEFDKRHGFARREVRELELNGQNYIDNTMDMMWKAIRDEDEKPFSRYAKAIISENYRRVYDRAGSEGKLGQDYIDCQLLCDFIAGMTDSYLIRTHDNLKPLHDGHSKSNSS